MSLLCFIVQLVLPFSFTYTIYLSVCMSLVYVCGPCCLIIIIIIIITRSVTHVKSFTK